MRRTGMVSLAAGAAITVVAVAILQRLRARSVSSAIACGGGAAVDIDDDRQAGAQPARLQRRFGHVDAHRDALHDLGEIAGGIFRRQQREQRARGGRQRRHRALEFVAVDGIDREFHFLAGNQLAKLCLLEIGDQIDLVERHDHRELLAGRNQVAELDRPIADHAVIGRAQHRERQVARRLVSGKFEVAHRRLRFLKLRFQNADIGVGTSDLGIGAYQHGVGLLERGVGVVNLRLGRHLGLQQLRGAIGGALRIVGCSDIGCLLRLRLAESRARCLGLRLDALKRLGLHVDLRFGLLAARCDSRHLRSSPTGRLP